MTLNVALLPDQAKDFIRSQPKIKDSAVYKIAVKFKKDPEYPVMDELKKSVESKRSGASAKKPFSISSAATSEFRNRLFQVGNFNEEDIEMILGILEGLQTQSFQDQP